MPVISTGGAKRPPVISTEGAEGPEVEKSPLSLLPKREGQDFSTSLTTFASLEMTKERIVRFA